MKKKKKEKKDSAACLPLPHNTHTNKHTPTTLNSMILHIACNWRHPVTPPIRPTNHEYSCYKDGKTHNQKVFSTITDETEIGESGVGGSGRERGFIEGGKVDNIDDSTGFGALLGEKREKEIRKEK